MVQVSVLTSAVVLGMELGVMLASVWVLAWELESDAALAKASALA